MMNRLEHYRPEGVSQVVSPLHDHLGGSALSDSVMFEFERDFSDGDGGNSGDKTGHPASSEGGVTGSNGTDGEDDPGGDSSNPN